MDEVRLRGDTESGFLGLVLTLRWRAGKVNDIMEKGKTGDSMKHLACLEGRS